MNNDSYMQMWEGSSFHGVGPELEDITEPDFSHRLETTEFLNIVLAGTQNDDGTWPYVFTAKASTDLFQGLNRYQEG